GGRTGGRRGRRRLPRLRRRLLEHRHQPPGGRRAHRRRHRDAQPRLGAAHRGGAMTQAVHRALRVLEPLVATAPDAPLGHIAKEAELSAPTTYRILQTLVADGYAVALDGGRYRPGAKILAV